MAKMDEDYKRKMEEMLDEYRHGDTPPAFWPEELKAYIKEKNSSKECIKEILIIIWLFIIAALFFTFSGLGEWLTKWLAS